jgi:hypothetical protein
MDEMVSRDDRLGREVAREKGRQDEKNLQSERVLAKEQGRKQGVNEERARETPQGGWGTGAKVVVGFVVLVIILALAAILTLSVNVTTVTPGNSLPFTTNYGVTIPEGQTMTIGNSQISVLSYQNELVSNIDGDQQKLVIGEARVINERRAVITTLGGIVLMDTIFKINLVYKGDRDSIAYFDMGVHTSRQVPDYLLTRLLPAAMNARPI